MRRVRPAWTPGSKARATVALSCPHGEVAKCHRCPSIATATFRTTLWPGWVKPSLTDGTHSPTARRVGRLRHAPIARLKWLDGRRADRVHSLRRASSDRPRWRVLCGRRVSLGSIEPKMYDQQSTCVSYEPEPRDICDQRQDRGWRTPPRARVADPIQLRSGVRLSTRRAGHRSTRSATRSRGRIIT